jgi:hypothetical protein
MRGEGSNSLYIIRWDHFLDCSPLLAIENFVVCVEVYDTIEWYWKVVVMSWSLLLSDGCGGDSHLSGKMLCWIRNNCHRVVSTQAHSILSRSPNKLMLVLQHFAWCIPVTAIADMAEVKIGVGIVWVLRSVYYIYKKWVGYYTRVGRMVMSLRLVKQSWNLEQAQPHDGDCIQCGGPYHEQLARQARSRW